MILYCVTVSIDEELAAEWADWMQREHIPQVLSTGCFLGCDMYRVLEPAGDSPTFQMHYRCRSLTDYEQYRSVHAPALQKDHTERYAGRFRASRQLLEILPAD